MTVSAEVQAVLDRVRTTTTLVESVDLGMAALREQVHQLGMKVDSIPVAVPASTAADTPVLGLASDDKQALLSMASDLDRSIAILQRDIPTNVPIAADATAAPAAALTPASHEADAAAAAAAIPLAGTGLPPEPPVLADGTSSAPATAPASTIPTTDPIPPAFQPSPTPPIDFGAPTTPASTPSAPAPGAATPST